MRTSPPIAALLMLAALHSCAAAADHWAYVAPRRPATPTPADRNWPRSPVDAFVRTRLEQGGLAPSPEADWDTLVRRATLALTGLPPTQGEVESLAKHRSPDAYERWVDRLIASPRYGERMAVDWLDLARYADTHGYHSDSQRTMWRWRDWVIDSLNAGMPYDQFTIEQLAGDLLPGATMEQRVATGFNRNHMLNDENGAIPAEFHCEYVVDRVVTTGAVWLGQTLLCARCHDHKYDPITQRDFYRLYAFFNNVPENGLGGRTGNSPPTLVAPTRRQQAELDDLAGRIAASETRMALRAAEAESAFRRWEQQALARPESMRRPPSDAALHLGLDDQRELTAISAVLKGNASWVAGKVNGALLCDGQTHIEVPSVSKWERSDAFSLAAWVFPTTGEPTAIVARVDEAQARRGYELAIEEDRLIFRLTHEADRNEIVVTSKQPLERSQWQHVVATYDGSSKASGVALFQGGVQLETSTRHDSLAGHTLGDQPLTVGRSDAEKFFRGMLDEVQLFARRLSADEIGVLAGGDPILDILRTPRGDRTPEQATALRRHFLEIHDPVYRQDFLAAAAAKERQKQVLHDAPSTMVMEELPQPRATFLLTRGLYNRQGERVTPGTPAALWPMAADLPPNRLGLARWLVDERNPLTTRVAVDRAWAALFGAGLVRTPDDWGSRGQPPTHPELLDWLARELVEHGWDVKRLHRMLATSAAFRQSSRLAPDLLARDPQNLFWARGPRYHLSAEAVRDQALAVGDLLDARVGGPSVRPYQPAELWRELAYNPDEYTAQVFVPSHGADLYRRSLYTFWKRSVPPPNLSLLDAPDRETCTVARGRTTTPLSALVLLNDETFVEAARSLAQRVLQDAGSDAQRIDRLFLIVLGRSATEREQTLLAARLAEERAEFRRDPAAAAKLIAVGESAADAALEPAELAAWTMIASVLLNLDETVSLR